MFIQSFYFLFLCYFLLIQGCRSQDEEVEEVEEVAQCDQIEIKTGENGLPDLGGCEVTIALENAYLPFNYIDPKDGVAKGWDYDVFTHMGELMNFTPVYMPVAWDGMIEAAADGKFMVAGDGITITNERKKIVDFSDGYMEFAHRVLVKSDNTDITSIEDLKIGDYKVAVLTGSTNYEVAVSLLDEDKVTTYDVPKSVITAVVNGDVDATIVDVIPEIGYLGPDKEKLKMVGDGLDIEELGFVFPKGSPLVEVFNKGIAKMKESGKLTEINTKFFSPDFKLTYDDIAECDEKLPEDYLPEDCNVTPIKSFRT